MRGNSAMGGDDATQQSRPSLSRVALVEACRLRSLHPNFLRMHAPVWIYEPRVNQRVESMVDDPPERGAIDGAHLDRCRYSVSVFSFSCIVFLPRTRECIVYVVVHR